MGKRILLFTGIILMAAIAFYLYYYRYNSTLSSRDTSFAVAEGRYNRVMISAREKQVELIRTSPDWKISGNDINQERLKNLLFASGNLDIVAPVGREGRDTLLQHLKNGIHVAFYNGIERVKAFDLCKLNNQIFAKLVRSRKPFRITVKGYPGTDLSQVYRTDSSFWKKDYLIQTTEKAINSVILLYPAHPEKSFMLKKEAGGKYLLSDPEKNKKAGPADTTSVHNFLSLLPVMNYKTPVDMNAVPEDSLKTKQELFILQITDKNGHKVEIRGFPKITGTNGTTDQSDFYALTSTKGLVLLSYDEFDLILLPREYFLKK